MTFDDIKENSKLIERIRESISSGNISHAYIFEGNLCVDKLLLANCFAKAILCEVQNGRGCDSCTPCQKIEHGNHEDIIYVESEGNSVKDEEVEQLQGRLKNRPYSGDRNIAIIKDADTLTSRAQNRLLKTLEEPPTGTVIILLSENIENLAQTILSRCVIYRFRPFMTPEYQMLAEEAEEILKMLLLGAPFYKTKAKVMDIALDRETAFRLLDVLEVLCGDLALGKKEINYVFDISKLHEAVRLIEEARRDLFRGMNIGYTLKSMIIKMEDR